MSQSIMDYVFRRLALDYLDFDTRSALGIHTAEERQRYLDTGSHQPISGGTTAAELIEEAPAVASGGAAGGSSATEATSESTDAAVKPAPSGAPTTSHGRRIERAKSHGLSSGGA